MKYVEEITESIVRFIFLVTGSILLGIEFGWLVGVGTGLLVHYTTTYN